MYHNQKLDFSLVKHVFFPAYFVLGGDYYEREKLMQAQGSYLIFRTKTLLLIVILYIYLDNCNSENVDHIMKTDIYTQDDCPETYGIFKPFKFIFKKIKLYFIIQIRS